MRRYGTTDAMPQGAAPEWEVLLPILDALNVSRSAAYEFLGFNPARLARLTDPIRCEIYLRRLRDLTAACTAYMAKHGESDLQVKALADLCAEVIPDFRGVPSEVEKI